MTWAEIKQTPLYRVVDSFVETVWHAGVAAAFLFAAGNPQIIDTPFAGAFTGAALGGAIIACLYGILFVIGALACLLLTCCGDFRFTITPETQ